MPIITMRDVRKAGYCSRGVRVFANKYNLDYQDFLLNGVDIDTLPDQDNEVLKKIREALE